MPCDLVEIYISFVRMYGLHTQDVLMASDFKTQYNILS